MVSFFFTSFELNKLCLIFAIAKLSHILYYLPKIYSEYFTNFDLLIFPRNSLVVPKLLCKIKVFPNNKKVATSFEKKTRKIPESAEFLKAIRQSLAGYLLSKMML